MLYHTFRIGLKFSIKFNHAIIHTSITQKCHQKIIKINNVTHCSMQPRGLRVNLYYNTKRIILRFYVYSPYFVLLDLEGKKKREESKAYKSSWCFHLTLATHFRDHFLPKPMLPPDSIHLFNRQILSLWQKKVHKRGHHHHPSPKKEENPGLEVA